MSWILIAEDNDDFRELLASAVRDHGYDVRTAADGVDMLEILERTPEAPAVVLLDLTMPRLGGRDALGAMRALPPTKHAPVVVMTGADVRAIDAEDLEVSAILQKPVSIGNVLSTIDSVSDRARS
jgi:CheY-like chemotaxis protein